MIGGCGGSFGRFNRGDDIADHRKLFLLLEDLFQNPADRRRDRYRRLFRFDFDDIFTGLDEVAFGLQPLANLHFADGLSHAGNNDVNHRVFLDLLVVSDLVNSLANLSLPKY